MTVSYPDGLPDEAWRDCTGSIEVDSVGQAFCAKCGHVFTRDDGKPWPKSKTKPAGELEYESWAPTPTEEPQ